MLMVEIIYGISASKQGAARGVVRGEDAAAMLTIFRHWRRHNWLCISGNQPEQANGSVEVVEAGGGGRCGKSP